MDFTFACLMMLSVAQITYCQMVEWLVNVGTNIMLLDIIHRPVFI
jgi:hypothetical protein